MRRDALEYADEIVEIFGKVNRDLLLVLKTNNYLRTIDMRLGSPGNSFSVTNDISWRVYSDEILTRKRLGYFKFFYELLHFYMLRIGMLLVEYGVIAGQS